MTISPRMIGLIPSAMADGRMIGTNRIMAGTASIKVPTNIKNATQTTKNNWNSVCNAGITAAAIAIYPQDKANAAQVIENALVSNAVAVEQMYSPDGNYGEGYGYWEYGTSYQICLNEMLIKAFGNDHGLSAINGFMKTGEFMLFMGIVIGLLDMGASALVRMLIA